MARPKSSIPTPFMRKRKNAYQIRWTLEDEEFAFSLGTVPKSEADITLRAVAIALANDAFWSPELLDYPAVKRYLARKAGRDKTESDSKLIEKYAHCSSLRRSAPARQFLALTTVFAIMNSSLRTDGPHAPRSTCAISRVNAFRNFRAFAQCGEQYSATRPGLCSMRIGLPQN